MHLTLSEYLQELSSLAFHQTTQHVDEQESRNLVDCTCVIATHWIVNYLL